MQKGNASGRRLHDGDHPVYCGDCRLRYARTSQKLRLGTVSELQRYLHSYLLVGAIGIYRNGDIPRQKDMEEIGSIGVDAGLAGFFHNKPDYSDEEWGRFCDRVRNGDAWLIEDGFYSSSGYGDGCYGVYAYKQDGAITALELRFL